MSFLVLHYFKLCHSKNVKPLENFFDGLSFNKSINKSESKVRNNKKPNDN